MKRLLFAVILFCLMTFRMESRADEAFNAAASSIAIIKTLRVSGTGFLYQDRGDIYLVTNEHITRGGIPITAQMLNGEKIVLKSLEIADNLDLVRFKIGNTNLPALKAAMTGYSIDDEVHVIGDSGGQGVATLLRGKILGVGPDRVEVSAEFIHGNSGSPVVLSNGRALAVATYVVLPDDPQDWVKRGTRFNQARRFGLRLDAAKWIAIKDIDYIALSDAMEDLRTYCEDLYSLAVNANGGLTLLAKMQDYSYNENAKRYRRWTGLCKLMATANISMKRWAGFELSYQFVNKDAMKPKSRGSYGNAASDYAAAYMMAESKAKNAGIEADANWKALWVSSFNCVDNTKWITTRFSDEAAYWRNVIAALAKTELKQH